MEILLLKLQILGFLALKELIATGDAILRRELLRTRFQGLRVCTFHRSEHKSVLFRYQLQRSKGDVVGCRTKPLLTDVLKA